MDNIQTSKTYQEDEIIGDRPISPIIKRPVPPSKQIMEPSLFIDETNLKATPISTAQANRAEMIVSYEDMIQS